MSHSNLSLNEDLNKQNKNIGEIDRFFRVSSDVYLKPSFFSLFSKFFAKNFSLKSETKRETRYIWFFG